jgi:hypothetical protein
VCTADGNHVIIQPERQAGSGILPRQSPFLIACRSAEASNLP